MQFPKRSSHDGIYRLIIAVLLVIGFSISGYHRRKAAEAGEVGPAPREEGLSVFLALRGAGLAVYGSILAYLVKPRWMRWSQLELPTWLRWVGAGVAALMLPLFYWLFSSIGESITPTVATKEEHTLVTHGPYRWVRHPLYTVGTVFLLAVSLIAANWFMAVGAVAMLAMLLVRLPQEEERLIETFGDRYREYMQRTGRLLPRW